MTNSGKGRLIAEGLKSELIEYLVAIVIVILIPIYHWYLTPLMALWGLLWIIDVKHRLEVTSKSLLKQKRLFVFFIGFFIWQIIGLAYTNNLSDGIRNITLRLPLLLFPLVLISTGEKIRKNVMLLLKIFAISTFIFLVIAVGYAIYRSLSIQEGRWIFNPHPANENWLNYFYASKFAIFQHPSYLSMFALFSGFIALESFLNISESLLSRFLWLLMSIVFLISIYLLSSRAAILTVFLTIPFYFIYKYFTGGIKKRGAIAFVISIFFLSVLFISNPRFNILIKNDVNNDLINKTQKESRISIWKSALYLIEDNLLLGVGTGNIQDELNKIYFNSENSNLIKVKDLNAHNQFIEIAAENGLVGLILFLAIFVMMTTIAISERNILYLLFVTIVFISFLFETMLNRLAGLSFFAFFSFLLVHLNDFKNIKTK